MRPGRRCARFSLDELRSPFVEAPKFLIYNHEFQGRAVCGPPCRTALCDVWLSRFLGASALFFAGRAEGFRRREVCAAAQRMNVHGRSARLRFMAGQIVFHCAAASGITHWVTCLRRLKNLRFLRISRTLTRVMLVRGTAKPDQPGFDLWSG